MPLAPSNRLAATLAASVDTVASSADLIDLLRSSAELARTAATTEPSAALVAQILELTGTDRLATLAAVEALATIDHPDAATALVSFLHHDAPIVARHASWRLAAKAPDAASIAPLVHQLTVGGIDTMHAHRTLRRWARLEPNLVLDGLRQVMPSVDQSSGRARLVDLLGAIDDSAAEVWLLLLARDKAEATATRATAVTALGHRGVSGAEQLLGSLARYDDELALHAALALDDLETRRRPYRPTSIGDGLRLAQLTLAGDLDPDLSSGGRGDTGGVASLIVSLGEALARRPEVEHVLTIGRGSLSDAIADRLTANDGLGYANLVIGDLDRPWLSTSQAWEHLPTIERGLARVLRARPPVDLIHLRMADVGTLAAMDVAAGLGIDVCFSLAPDPHGLIESQQASGELDRESFADRTAQDHLWFRARLVEQLAGEARRLALFPRRHGDRYFGELTRRRPVRAVVVPEGIDVGPIRRAEVELREPQPLKRPPEKDILDDLADRVPPSRQHLPLLLSVGRLNPVKGMERIASAWGSDPELQRSCTLVIVGGSLVEPSPVEQEVLDAIGVAVPDDHPARSGLVLLGGRPRVDIARLLAATVAGHPGGWAGGGIYVNGAVKEEFGLALIEALAAGLVVVAPSTGGPPTFIDHGDTGLLVAADDDLAPVVRRAFQLVAEPGRAERARRLVEDEYSIDLMVDRLIDLYQPAPVLTSTP